MELTESLFVRIYKLRTTNKITTQYYQVLHKLLRNGKLTDVQTRIQNL